MKMIVSLPLICFTLALSVSAPAQIVNYWGKVDTVTAGEFDDLNPSLVHNAFESYADNFLRVVFERHTSTESQIAARSFSRSSATWDSAVVVLSSLPSGEEQKRPDYSEVSYNDTGLSLHVIRLAAWQVRKEGRWQIFYSTLNDGASAWSSPSILVTDSLDNTCVQVRPFLDSALIITWKRSNTVMWLSKTMHTSTPPETLAVGSSDSMEYDVSTRFGVTGVIWTSNVQGKMTPLFRTLNRYSLLQFSTPETLQVAVPCAAPHLAISQTPDPTFVFETPDSGRHDVFYFLNFWSTPSGSLSNDPLSDNRNARSFNYPYITKQAAGIQTWIPSFLGVVVYERYRGGDSSLVFVYGPWGDTVRTPGHNRNALVSSQPFFTITGGNVLVVWESNRSGRGHIYSRLVPMVLGAIISNPPHTAAFELKQNYPNPFNPVTNIQFSIDRRLATLVRVYDVLGREVSTLVNEVKEPGTYTVQFDGSNLASGVYFYRLQAGGFVQTRRFVILK